MFSKYDVYTTVQSVYCYPDSDVLKNKLNIRDKAELNIIHPFREGNGRAIRELISVVWLCSMACVSTGATQIWIR